MDYINQFSNFHLSNYSLSYIKNWIHDVPSDILNDIYNKETDINVSSDILTIKPLLSREQIEKNLLKIVYMKLCEYIRLQHTLFRYDNCSEFDLKIVKVIHILEHSLNHFDLIQEHMNPYRFSVYIDTHFKTCNRLIIEIKQQLETKHVDDCNLEKLYLIINKTKKYVHEFKIKKYGLLLKRIEFNRDIFRNILSYT